MVRPRRCGYRAPVTDYSRPDIAAPEYRDASGMTIPYGTRWPDHVPPDDSYSRVSNPERFAPLLTVTQALISWLTTSYAVQVTDDMSVATDLMNAVPTATRAVRLSPSAARAATLTFVTTDFPGVIVHAGLAQDFPFPNCGCDACDETWASCSDELEAVVDAVVEGRYHETITRTSADYALETANGRRWGGRQQTDQAIGSWDWQPWAAR